jgi:hypothetical protein
LRFQYKKPEKRPLLSQFYTKVDDFTKTGSGQTQGELKKRDPVFVAKTGLGCCQSVRVPRDPICCVLYIDESLETNKTKQTRTSELHLRHLPEEQPRLVQVVIKTEVAVALPRLQARVPAPRNKHIYMIS